MQELKRMRKSGWVVSVNYNDLTPQVETEQTELDKFTIKRLT